MLAAFLSILALLFNWAVAYLFAVPLTYLVRSSGLINFPVLRVFKPMAGNVRVRGLQKFLFTGFLISLALVLSLLLDTEPALQVLAGYFQNFMDFEPARRLMGGLLSNLVLALGLFVIWQTVLFMNELFPRLYTILEGWRNTRFHVVKFKSMELVTPDQITAFLLSLSRYLRAALTLILLVSGLTYTLSFFPGTQGIAFTIIESLYTVFHGFGATVLGFVPNFVALLLIVVVTRYTLKLLHFFYEGIQNNRIKVFGLHKDLAEPTYQLLRFLIFALAIVAAYPYLPGSNSPVFRGITIFAGFLLSLGSTALVTNIVSGVVLTYTRGLRIGDRVKIGTTTGDVIERTMLVTRIRTIKNVVVSIPNSMVLNNEIVNYSALTGSRDGLILNTTVTIGYDVPWRKVYELLIRAALSTRDIQRSPQPFVLQTSLDDYYVSYELNAYTSEPKRMALIYSELHQNIQDHFNRADVEIMSPAYTAYREGNKSTVVA